MKGRYTVNPFPELALTEADRASLEDLANAYIMSNLELCMKFMSSGRRVDPTRWKPLKERKGLKIYSERKESMTQRKVTFCTKCMSEVTSMNALDIARAKLLNVKNGVNYSGTTGYSSTSNLSDISYCSQ
ncbi:hypothetical protein PC112_g16159 [Phytophthora cactorum]|nr:hypothetical protein PC112_g16159 [Phytophthora cactorum]